MEVLVLKNRLKHVAPIHLRHDGELTPEEQDLELSLIMGNEQDYESRDREIKAHTDRIRMLEEELQRARTEAYQAGFQEGQMIAKAEAEKQYSRLAQEFNDNIHAIQGAYTEVLEHLSAPILDIAMGAAEKLIHRELTLDQTARDVLVAQIQRILNETATQTRTLIQVNPSQLDWITGRDIISQLNSPHKENLRFIPNPKLQPGECLVETEDFLIDGTIQTQLDILEKALLEDDAANPSQI